MKVKNNTDAPWLRVGCPRSRINWKHLFLVALHAIVLLASAVSQDFRVTEVTPGALPQAFCERASDRL
jgi:hypothetical protein